MPASKLVRRRRTPARTIASGIAGVALAATALAASPAAAAAGDEPARVEQDPSAAVVEIDLWRAFRYCLHLHYAALDAMYPAGPTVNECLESKGIL